MEGNSSMTEKAVRGAEIIKGATKTAAGIASGNVAAVVQGISQLLPGRVVAIIIACALFFTLLPVIIIFSVPQMIFSWATVNDTDLITRNQYGSSLYESYFNIILEQGSDVSPDVYMLIAIDSVLHRQNINEMTEDDIRASVCRSFTQDNDGAVHYKTPDNIMDELGFSDQEKNWANFMYSNMSYQYVDPGTAEENNGQVMTDTNGDVIGDAGEVQVVYYSQLDERWKNILYGRTGTIGTSGCGPSSLAIAVSTLTEQNITPVETASWAYQNGYRCEGSGSYHSLIPEGAKHYGLKVEKLGRSSARELARVLSSGKLVIAIMAKGHFTKNGHYIVLRGITDEGKVLVADPASRKRSNQEWDISIVLNEARGTASAGGPFWAISK